MSVDIDALVNFNDHLTGVSVECRYCHAPSPNPRICGLLISHISSQRSPCIDRVLLIRVQLHGFADPERVDELLILDLLASILVDLEEEQRDVVVC